MDISLRILESESEISKRILEALLPDVSRYFNKVFIQCESKIVQIVQQAIVSHPTYNSLLSGDLLGEFGLDGAGNRLSEILSFWEKLTVKYEKPKVQRNQIFGSFSLSMIQSDYSDVLGTGASVVTTDHGDQLEWLKWLLLFGDKTIIRNYHVELGPNIRSRSGNGIMVVGGRWHVPTAYAGTVKSNWITKAIDSSGEEIMNLMKQALRS